MELQTQSALIGAASFIGALLMFAGIFVREKINDQRKLCANCPSLEDTKWKWRHAIRWLMVCLLLLETLHHVKWTLLPDMQFGGDYILPDVGVAILGLVYGVSLLSHSRDMLFRKRGNKTDFMPLE